MQKLTEEQMVRANEAWCSFVYGTTIPLTDKVREIFQAVAPCLQIHPCNHKRVKEYPCFYTATEAVTGDKYPTHIYFCEECGVAVAKPVDPRIGIVKKALMSFVFNKLETDAVNELFAEHVVKALDEVK